MKKILSLCLALALCLGMLAACTPAEPTTTQPSETTPSTEPSDTTPVTEPSEEATEPSTEATEPVEDEYVIPTLDPNAGPTDLFFGSEVTALEGNWVLSQVYADGTTTDAVADAMFLEISLELDPSELVDGEAYIHNQVYNLTGSLTFGLDAVNEVLAADEVEEYRGSTAWSDFPQGQVVEDGQFYKQYGPATMRFRDLDGYGLFLDQVAGLSADLDTTEKTLVIGMNGEGQLLLGCTEDHLERPGSEGEWTYLLIFDKVA